jgi:hypothetical protein
MWVILIKLHEFVANNIKIHVNYFNSTSRSWPFVALSPLNHRNCFTRLQLRNRTGDVRRYRLIWVLPHWKGHESGDEQKLLPNHIESFHETIGQWRIRRVTQQSTAALPPRIISWGNQSMEDLKIGITINWRRTRQIQTYFESWKVLQSVLRFTKRVDIVRIYNSEYVADKKEWVWSSHVQSILIEWRNLNLQIFN